ncbi:MAG: DUF1254 domain-containing protein [Rhizobiaceae bacterium]|nr:DUF1254 domain-containing protein [Rhizobiaceae bacterium]
MKRSFYALSVAFVLAGIVHTLIVLLIPSYAARDAWAKLEQVASPWQFSIVAAPGKSNEILPLVDPAFGIAACRFDLTQTPLWVSAEGQLAFWSIAIFDRQGQNIYSFNDRTAIERQLALIVVNPVQMAQFRKSPPANTDKAVLVETDTAEGFVLIRALQENQSWAPPVDQFLTSARCERFLGDAEAQPTG